MTWVAKAAETFESVQFSKTADQTQKLSVSFAAVEYYCNRLRADDWLAIRRVHVSVFGVMSIGGLTTCTPKN